ncbi:MAG: hypothetical protein FD127_447 [Acidimicrobiaceae bacterium]|nr:MAG: hypothetical protein FD127_447 [Acidimicrobiaceae bacterium]
MSSLQVTEALARAVASGLLTAEAAEAIVANEKIYLASTERAAPPERRGLPAVTEAIGYVGACLVMIGMVVFVGQYWDDLATWSRLTIMLAVTALLLGVGAFLPDDEPVTWRLRNFVWLLAVGALAGFTGVLVVDALEWTGPGVAISIGCAVTACSLALWQGKDRPAQQLSTFVGALIATGGVMALIDGDGAIGVSVVSIGAAWLVLGVGHVIRPKYAALPLGSLAMLVGPMIAAESWPNVAPVIGLAVAISLIAAGAARHEFVMTGAGVLGLFVFLPMTLGELFGDTVGAPLILLVSGALLLIVMLVVIRAKRRPDHSAT